MTRLFARATDSPPRIGPRLAALVGVLLVIAACGNSSATVAPAAASRSPDERATVLTTATLMAGQFVPPPVGPALLTVTGKIAKTNVGQGLSLDLATVQRLGLRKVTVYEPWVKHDLDFQGVWLSELVRAAGAAPAATSLHLTALDNYQIDLPLSDVMAGGIFLATGTGTGAPIPVDDGGPDRILFVGDVPSGKSPDQWIWSLSTIDVR